MTEDPIDTEPVPPHDSTCFVVLVRAAEGPVSSFSAKVASARLVVESLRAFGGTMSDCPVWVFSPDPTAVSRELPDLGDVQFFSLEIEDDLAHYIFADKVCACATAEAMASSHVRSLVWLSTGCLVVKPPTRLDLLVAYEAAVRPVHIRNIGSLASEPLDAFWSQIYRTAGLRNAPFTVESFVDARKLRPYFNTHCFAVDPSRGVLEAWWEAFRALVTDAEFQSGACGDQLHRVFLHQAILGALIAEMLDPGGLLILPPEYGYPLHLHEQTPPERRATALNDVVCAAYEDGKDLKALDVHEPLKTWLKDHTSGSDRG
jgi:hypothetical protein